MKCSGDRWGFECQNPCTCQNGGECNHVTGACTCIIGYHGNECESICVYGTFGHGCKENCKCNFEHTESCLHTSGTCNCETGEETYSLKIIVIANFLH